MTSITPVFVIVPGAFTTPVMFQEFCDFARSQGVVVTTVALPTVGKRSERPLPDIAADGQAICRVVEPFFAEGKEVILVTSSLGGVAGTQCLEHLSLRRRTLLGKKGGIKKVVYVTALIVEPDKCALDFFGADPPPMMQFKEGDEYAIWPDHVDDGTLTFSDLPRPEALRHKAKMERFHSRANFEDRLTYPGYQDVAVHYVVCEDDQIIPRAAQLHLIATLEKYVAPTSSDGSSKVTVHTIKGAGHLPFVTKIEDTLRVLREVATSC